MHGGAKLFARNAYKAGYFALHGSFAAVPGFINAVHEGTSP